MRSSGIALIRKAQAFVRRLLGDERGNVLTLFALALPVVIGMLGLGIEGASWYQLQRAEQNAADAAAVAAANNGGSSTYNVEAAAVATLYGYTNSTANTTVTASNAAACPAGGTNCYSVTISRLLPLSLSTIVGFRGDTTVNGARAITITATAIATQINTPRQYCIVALATSGTAVAFTSNGGSKADLTGCSIMSNTDMVCNGHNLNATYGDAHGSNSGCGITEEDSVPLYVDPYAALASKIPADTCNGSYPQEPVHNNDPALPTTNLISGTPSWNGTQQTLCGDVQLTGNVTLTGSNTTTLVIRNGKLDTNGYTIQTASGATATVIFTGNNSSSSSHTVTGGGTIDIAAPTTGTWSNIALYQDPALTSGVDITYAGNKPTWDITGLVYLPNSNVTISGIVNKSSNGKTCFAMVANTITFNGTATIIDQGQCSQAGDSLPSNNLVLRGKLVA